MFSKTILEMVKIFEQNNRIAKKIYRGIIKYYYEFF